MPEKLSKKEREHLWRTSPDMTLIGDHPTRHELLARYEFTLAAKDDEMHEMSQLAAEQWAEANQRAEDLEVERNKLQAELKTVHHNWDALAEDAVKVEHDLRQEIDDIIDERDKSSFQKIRWIHRIEDERNKLQARVNEMEVLLRVPNAQLISMYEKGINTLEAERNELRGTLAAVIETACGMLTGGVHVNVSESFKKRLRLAASNPLGGDPEQWTEANQRAEVLEVELLKIAELVHKTLSHYDATMGKALIGIKVIGPTIIKTSLVEIPQNPLYFLDQEIEKLQLAASKILGKIRDSKTCTAKGDEKMGIDLDELNEMYDGTLDNRGSLKRDYDALKEEHQKLRTQLKSAGRTSDVKIAERLVEILDARSEGSESGSILAPYAVVGVTYTAVRVFDTTIWDNEDENTPPEDSFDTVKTALAHSEDAIRDIIAALQALLVEVEEDPIFVIVNGSREQAPSRDLSHHDVVRLAYPQHEGELTKWHQYLTVVYHWPKGDNRHGGTLHGIKEVHAVEGMYFSVADTGNA